MWRSLVARLTGGQEVVGSNPVIPTMITFITILTILTLVLFFCMFRTQKSKKPISKVMFQLMVSALFPVASNVLIIFSPDATIGGWGYACYFASTDWMLAYMLRFCAEYCDYPYRRTKWERIVGLIAGLDTVMIFLNPVLHHCFKMEQYTFEDGSIYFKYDSLWYHYIHLGFSYAIVAACMIMLIVKIARSSALYREKYIVIEFSTVVVAVWELYYVLNKSVLEYSMISYLTMAILVYFFAIEYKPYIATYRMFSEVVTNITEAIFFFDDNYKCILVNRRAKELYEMNGKSIKAEAAMDGVWNYAKEVITNGEVDIEDILMEGYFQCIRNFTVEGEKYTYDIEFQKINDKKGRTAGSFLAVKDRTEEQRRIDKERYQATHDSLTGIYNADYMFSRIEKLLIENPDQRYVVVTSDIKGFKMVNDIYGRKTGDEILINLANQIRANASEDTIYGRIGGDKFGLIMNRKNFREEIFEEGVMRVKTDMDKEKDMFYPIIIHVGVYEVTDKRIPPSVMFDRATMALATIKDDMQKRIAYYDVNLREIILWEQRIAGSIDAGLEEEQILGYVQPQVTIDGTICGVELLARWMHPTEGFLRPKRFLPTLEKNGYIVRVDQYMWEKACKIVKQWEKQGWDDLYVSVNISPVDFFFIDVVEVFVELTEKYEVDPKKLRLEITEHTMMYDAKRRIEAIYSLREHGFIVEMDDFGNGFSSLNMLKDIPLDVIKIDMVFLEKTREEEKAKEILKSIISLAKRLKLPVITEGVETKEQLQFLSGIGCDMFQGYYYSRAVPVAEFEERYMRTGGGRIIRES